MGTFSSMLKLMMAGILVFIVAGPAAALFENKFEQEVETETGAVKLVREVQLGGYDLVTTAELKQWIDAGKDMVIVSEPGLYSPILLSSKPEDKAFKRNQTDSDKGNPSIDLSRCAAYDP